MRRNFAIAVIGLLALSACGKQEPGEQSLKVDPYGTVHVFRNKAAPTNAAIIFSGQEGWTPTLTSRALGISWPDRVVIGVDLPSYLKALKPTVRNGKACLDFTAAMPQLLRAAADAVKQKVDPAPLVLGYGDGGTVALAAAAQSQPKSIEGVIAEQFCPQWRGPIPPCAGPGSDGETVTDSSGQVLVPPKQFQAPFVAIADGTKCAAVDLDAFAEAMPDARVVEPVPGRDIDLVISVATQTGRNVAAIPAVGDADMADLPLIEVPSAPGQDDRLAVILTGDGGWADIDKSIGEALAARGVGVVGFSTLKYFWKEQTPEQAAMDLERVLRHYTTTWNRKRIVLVGYSFGASVLPFLIPRLPDDLRHMITLDALLAPAAHASFEISVGGWIGDNDDEGPDVAAAMAGLDHPVLCLRSDEEDDSPCPTGGHGRIQTVVLKGDHHFDGAYAAIAQRILDGSAAK